MWVPLEAALVAGAFAFYLGDALVLLYADELLLVRGSRGWTVERGGERLIAGRRPYLPAPLAPQRPLLRVRLDKLAEPAGGGNDARHYCAALRPFGTLARAMLVLFGLLPGVLYAFGAGAVLLAWMGCVYALASAVGVRLVSSRRVLELSPRVVAGLAFECVACPPFAINIVRRLGLARSDWSPAQLRVLLDEAERRELLAAVDACCTDVLAAVDPGTGHRARLAARRAALQEALGA